jgi:hypothetical protein
VSKEKSLSLNSLVGIILNYVNPIIEQDIEKMFEGIVNENNGRCTINDSAFNIPHKAYSDDDRTIFKAKFPRTKPFIVDLEDVPA